MVLSCLSFVNVCFVRLQCCNLLLAGYLWWLLWDCYEEKVGNVKQLCDAVVLNECRTTLLARISVDVNQCFGDAYC